MSKNDWHQQMFLGIKVDNLHTCCRFIINGLVVMLVMALIADKTFAEEPWPEIALPRDIRVQQVGAPITVNGILMRMTSFTTKMSKEETAKWFRQSLGKPLVENIVSNKLILGRAIGNRYYLSIQLQAVEFGTKVLIAVSDPKTGFQNRAAAKADFERLTARLPHGSRLISHTTSVDGNKQSSYLVVANSYSEEVNRERVVSNMREDGLYLEREAAADGRRVLTTAGIRPNGKALFFKGAKTEAIAVISRAQEGTSVVLNTVTTMDTLK